MENTKAKKLLVIILIVLLLVCLGVIIWQYVVINNSKNVLEKEENIVSKQQNTETVQEETEIQEKEETQDETVTTEEKKEDIIQKEQNDEIKYPTTNGPIFEYEIDDLNENVSNKKQETNYVKIMESNKYEISKDRKSITIKNDSLENPTLKFDKEIYHASLAPYGQGQLDIWVILFIDGTVKYTTNYGETIKDGPNHIVDLFSVEYSTVLEEGRKMAGSTVIVVNEFGGLIDLMHYNSEK